MPSIYIPLCIYFNCHMLITERWHDHLHSTMYLFQLRFLSACANCGMYLHSTMYLFQPITPLYIPTIKTYLHSTMYLFQLYNLLWLIITWVSFTFHYVSISTCLPRNLHTIKLLFTFHYVSISTLHPVLVVLLVSCIYIPLCIYFNI